MKISLEEMIVDELRGYLDFDKRDTKMLLSQIDKYQKIGKENNYAYKILEKSL